MSIERRSPRGGVLQALNQSEISIILCQPIRDEYLPDVVDSETQTPDTNVPDSRHGTTQKKQHLINIEYESKCSNSDKIQVNYYQECVDNVVKRKYLL